MGVVSIGGVNLDYLGVTESGYLHFMHFKLQNLTNKTLYITVKTANGYHQSEGYEIIHPNFMSNDFMLPVRMFGDTWEKPNIALDIGVYEIIPNGDFDRQLQEYYADPDVPYPSEMVYSEITSKTFKFRIN